MAAFLCTMLTGCFTGIESTPKITSAEVRKQTDTESTPEESYLSGISSGDFSKWHRGKEFYITDDKISLIFKPSGSTDESLAGSYMYLEDIAETTSLTGDKVAEITLLSQKGHQYVYRLDRSLDAIKQDNHMEIPFTIEKSVVDTVRALMNGNTYYITTSAWLDTMARPRNGRKFVPVNVTDVRPGNTFYPVLLELNDENGVPFTMYLSVGNDIKSTRKFSTMFSLTDPRLRYPNISDATWKLIINGKVAVDMTRDECRLALGQPDDVDRSHGYSSVRERWSYENGIYLIFEDGLLRSFRQ